MGIKSHINFNQSVIALEDAHYVTVASGWNARTGGHYLGFKKDMCFIYIRRVHEGVNSDIYMSLLESDFDYIATQLGYVKREEDAE